MVGPGGNVIVDAAQLTMTGTSLISANTFFGLEQRGRCHGKYPNALESKALASSDPCLWKLFAWSDRLGSIVIRT